MQNDTYLLEKKLNKIYDHLYANAPVRTPKGIANEVGKILRALSHLEESKGNKNPAISLSSLERRHLKAGDESIIKHLSHQVENAFKEMNNFYKLYKKDDSKLILSDFDIAYVCVELDRVNLSSKTKDVFGDAMEIFRSSWTKTHGGQFFTDQKVTNLAVSLLQFNPLKGEDLVDICAGTGGFLLAGLNKIKDQIKDDGDKLEKKIEEIAPQVLKGLEIDEDIRVVGNATLAARTDKDCELIEEANSIEPSNFRNAQTKISYDSHDCVATNPPFGTKITIKDSRILKEFELSRAFVRNGDLSESQRLVPRPPDILFLEQNIRLLKPGKGRIAIILPYQILSGPQALFVRRWLLRKVELIAVIDLPANTFQPHTGTKASLVVAKRRAEEIDNIDEVKDPDIFMSKPKWIGHDRRGNPVFEKHPDGSASFEILSDIEEVALAFEKALKGEDPQATHKESFFTKASEIFQDPMLRLDAQYYKSHKSKNLEYQDIWRENKKDWDLVPLNSLVQRIFYPGRFARNYVEEDIDSVPFMGGTNISQLIVHTDKRIAVDDKKITELKVNPRWILITRSGSTGIVSSVPHAWDGHAISEHVIRIVPDEKKIPYEYLYAFLKSDYAREVMRKGVYGSVIDEITPEYIGEISVPIPKDKKSLQSVVDEMRKGEIARDQAIDRLTQGTKILEDLFIRS